MGAYTLLGVHFDETLSFQHHVDFLCNKLSRALFCINRAKNFLDLKSLKMLYFALFYSNLLYCIGTLSSMSKTNANRIQKFQDKAIRSISLAKSRQQVNPIYHDLKILPYDLLQKQIKLCFMHAAEYDYAPKSCIKIWHKNEQRNINYQLKNNDLYYIISINYNHLKTIPLFSGRPQISNKQNNIPNCPKMLPHHRTVPPPPSPHTPPLSAQSSTPLKISLQQTHSYLSITLYFQITSYMYQPAPENKANPGPP